MKQGGSAFHSSYPDDDPFDPYDLRPLASLNRRKIIALPGVDPAWVDLSGWELCAKPALIRLIQEHAAALGLQDAAPEDLPLFLNTCLESPDPPVREAAEAVAWLHGRRLGVLVASLLLSPERLSDPLVPWEEAYLQHWRTQIDDILLGGGLASPGLGRLLAESAAEALHTAGIHHLRLRPAENPSFLPLIGAARGLTPGENGGAAVLVADFGGSRAKRGLAFYDTAGALHQLRLFPPLPTTGLTDRGRTADLAAALCDILAATLQQAAQEALVAEEILCSAATYVVNGRPAVYPGAFNQLYEIAPDINAWLAGRISAASGRPVRIRFVHDCDAAAGAFSGLPRTAVIMLGTALGTGFVPPPAHSRPLAEGFTIDPPDL